MTPVIELTGISKGYRTGPIELNVLQGVDLVVKAGQSIALSGRSGSGKSTLLNVLGLLDRPDAGSYRIDGREVGAAGDDERTILRNRKLGFIFQHAPLFPRLTVEENVAVPLLYRGESNRRALESARAVLSRLKLGVLGDRRPDQLSGGQRQRVAIARALVGQPKIILADEPTSALDDATTDEIMRELLDTIRAWNAALILITHQSRAAALADFHYQLVEGKLQATSPVAVPA